MSEAFTTVATLDDFAATDVVAVQAGGREIALYLVDGAVFATDNRCSHGDARLCEGFLEGHEIECPHHQGRFDVRSGVATCAPAEVPLRIYAARLEGANVEVALGEAGPAG